MKNATSPHQIRGYYDVVVVGARAAGAATAMLLARRGLRVLAVDRAAYGSDTLSTHNISLPGVFQLSKWGVLDAIRAAGTPRARRVIFRYGDHEVPLDIPVRGDLDGLYSPRRTVLDAALVDAAVASGAHVRHGVSMVGVTNDSTGRVDGVVLDVDGERRRVPARFVVGADGMRSKVARLVQAPTTHTEDSGAASIYSYWEGLPDDIIDNHYEVGKAGGIIPTNDGVAVVWTALRPEEFATAARGDLAGAHHRAIRGLPRMEAELATATQVGGYRGFPGHPGFLRQAYGPGWALVGDAGYFKDPVSAHGITDAFIGAELLSDALADVHYGANETCALARFADDRDRLAAELMPAVARVASLDTDLETIASAFKEMAAAMRSEFAFLMDRHQLAA